MKHNIIYGITSAMAMLALLPSCRQEAVPSQRGAETATVKMSVTVSSVKAKGELINTTGIDAAFAQTDSFYVNAWTGTQKSIDESKVKCVQIQTAAENPYVLWTTVDADNKIVEYTWKSSQNKTFYAYANLPADGASSVASSASDNQTLTHVVPLAAADQTDILLGYYSGDGKTEGKMTGTASIKFYHSLSAVAVKMGTVEGISSINSISIEGVYAEGTAQMTPTTMEEALDCDKVVWTPGDAFVTISQSVSSTPASDSQEIVGESFLVIPQTFPADSKARIRIDFTPVSGTDYSIFIPLAGKEWKAGNQYCYTLNYRLSN